MGNHVCCEGMPTEEKIIIELEPHKPSKVEEQKAPPRQET